MSDYPIPFTVSDLCTFGPERELGIVQEILTAQLPDFAIVVLYVASPHPDVGDFHTRHIYMCPKHVGGWRQHPSDGFPLTNISRGETWR